MNFRQLEIYNAVMIGGSASRASQLLNITQPAVSRALADLEYRVGFKLFDRVKGRLVPTPEGQLFFKDVERSFTGLDSLRAAAARIRDFGSGSIRLASLAALGSTLVPLAIRKFVEENPHVAITLQVLSSPGVRSLVATEQFDIGLAADEVDLSGVEHSLFATLPAICAIPPKHPLAQKKIVTPEDLHEVAFVALSPEDRARARMTEVFDAAKVRPSIVVETPNSATVCSLVLEQVGVGLVNPAATDGFEERGVVFRPFEPTVEFRVYLLFRPDARRTKLAKALVSALEDALVTRYAFADSRGYQP